MTDQSIAERWRACGPWVHAMLRQLFPMAAVVPLPAGRRLVVIDASSMQAPGATGTDHRLHIAMDLGSLQVLAVLVSEVHTGETLQHCTLAPGDVAVADRCYAHGQGMSAAVEQGAELIVRLNPFRVVLGNDYRLRHILDALFATNLHGVFSVITLKALEVYAILTSWLHQDTTTIALYGAYEDAQQTLGAPRPTYGHSKDGRGDLKQVLLSLGVSSDGGLPLRVGMRDGNTSDSVETPVAIEECLALGLEGVHRIVAESKA